MTLYKDRDLGPLPDNSPGSLTGNFFAPYREPIGPFREIPSDQGSLLPLARFNASKIKDANGERATMITTLSRIANCCVPARNTADTVGGANGRMRQDVVDAE
jgi:hypothetical protein